jgi:zinc/manganese transport system permease protein
MPTYTIRSKLDVTGTLYLAQPFAFKAVVAATAVAVACGAISPLIVARRLTFVVHSTSELAFTGGVAGLLFFSNPTAGAFIGALILAVVLARSARQDQQTDAATGVILAAGIALGIFLLGFYHGYVSAATSILFGQLFAVSSAQLYLLLAVSALVVAGRLVFGRSILLAVLDPELAHAYGIDLTLSTFVLTAMVVGSATAAAQVVGTLLVLTLSVAPGLAASHVASSYRSTVVASMALAVLGADGGTILALLVPQLRPSVAVAAASTFLFLAARLWASIFKGDQR